MHCLLRVQVLRFLREATFINTDCGHDRLPQVKQTAKELTGDDREATAREVISVAVRSCASSVWSASGGVALCEGSSKAITGI